jgi:hypothetical protein
MGDLEESTITFNAAPETAPTTPASQFVSLPPAEPINKKKIRSEKQKEATEKMKAERWESRKRKTQAEIELEKHRPIIEAAEKEKQKLLEAEEKEKQKSMEIAAAMFMDLRKRKKDSKKEKIWEEQLNQLLTERMDEFEDRLVGMFHKPIDHFMNHRRKKPKQEEKEEKVEKPIKHVEEAPDKPKSIQTTKAPVVRKYAAIKNPFGK